MNNKRALPVLALLLLAASQAQAKAQPASQPKPAPPQTITVIMIDDEFQPSHLTFQAGQAYRLHLENHGKHMHEFTAPAFLKASTIKDKSKLANRGTDIVVQPGKSTTILLTAPPKGHYDLTCADHDWEGMTGDITVD